jgi:hypothetical protein
MNKSGFNKDESGLSKDESGFSQDESGLSKDESGLAAGRWFSPGTPDSSKNKTDRHDITDILLKVPLNTITLALSLIRTS